MWSGIQTNKKSIFLNEKKHMAENVFLLFIGQSEKHKGVILLQLYLNHLIFEIRDFFNIQILKCFYSILLFLIYFLYTLKLSIIPQKK